MTFAAIIAALISVFGPMLLAWIQKWLESRANKAAARLPAVGSFASEHDARNALFDAMIEDLPRAAFARRSLLRRLKGAAARAGVTSTGAASPISPEDAGDIADAVGIVDE